MRNEIFYAIWINKDVTVISDCTLPMWAGESEEKNTCHLAAIRLLPLPAVTPHGELWGNWMWKHRISSVQSLSHARLFVTPWTATHQVPLPITNSQSLLKLMSIESVMPSNYLTLCPPLLFLPSIFLSIKVFSNESALRIRWPKYWRFSMSPSNEYSGLISLGLTGLISLQSKRLSKVLSRTTVQKASVLRCSTFFMVQLISVHDDWKNHSFDYMDLCQQSNVSAF